MSTKMKLEFLSNELFIECFEYLNAPDIFYSFDRLNYRFHTLIRRSPLHLNFQQLKKSLFDEFCQIILSNPEIKQNIISLQISDKDTRGQIESFLSMFSFNEFIHLRSLLVINIKDDTVQQILPMLPFLSDLYCFFCTNLQYRPWKITPAILKSKIRRLTVPQIDFNSTSIYETISLTSLTIDSCDLSDLCQLLKYIPLLKYLTIESFCDSKITDDQLTITNTNVVQLKQLILNYSSVKFQALELLLKRISNLKILSICARYEMEMVDADRWQHLIETSLPHLHVFNFDFGYIADDSSDEKSIKLRKFQTDFWHEQHHWYTNCEIDKFLASVYTIPYTPKVYQLKSTRKRYINSLTSDLNVFDNVTNLSLELRAIRNDSSYYFRNVQSLTLTKNYIDNDDDDGDKTDEYDLSTTQIKLLNTITVLSNIKHLSIDDVCHISSSLLSKILKKLPNVSSLKLHKRTLISFLKNRELCKCLNRKILKLDIAVYYRHRYITSNQIDLLCKTFSNLEQLHCYIENIDDLLLMLAKFSKLSVIKLGLVSRDISSWIQMNGSTSNVCFVL